MRPRSLLAIVLSIAVSCASPAPEETASLTASRPNILFILSDDHATNALGCYPSRLSALAPTPNLDRLATEGVRLTSCFCSNSICTPSRAAILTGQHSHANGVYSLWHALDPERQNVAKLLRKGGYQTAVVGKWHLKSDPSGFDYWNILPGQGRYHDPLLREIGSEEARRHEGFSTDVITDLSLRWLEGRDRAKPFCLMVHFKNCHEPWEYAERHGELFAGVEIPEPASLGEDKSHRSDGSREYGLTMETMAGRLERPGHGHGVLDLTGMGPQERKSAAYQRMVKDYLKCVAAIDENVGRLVAWLEGEGLADDTLVIYSSDQGYFLGEHDYIDKRWMYEESLRMPFLARYPREIEPGTLCDDIITNVDFAKTFLDYADLDGAGLEGPEEMQGRSFRGNLAGRTPADWPESMYYRYWQHGSRPAHLGVRTSRYKLIFFSGVPLEDRAERGAKATKSGWELYDLELDPHELRNVHEDPTYAPVVEELKRELTRLREELGDLEEGEES
jgi:arylsulfatase A-like enzyme